MSTQLFNRTKTSAAVRSMIAVGLMTAAALPAQAADFKIGDYDLTVNSTVSVGTSWRAEGRDRALYAVSNTDQNGVRGTGFSNATDDGNLNYDNGDTFSTILKGVHDFDLKKQNYGFFGRVKWFYDYEQNKGSVHHGHEPNNYVRNSELNDTGFHPFARFDGIDILDFYGYYNTTIADKPVGFRLGRQVLGWGESIFLQNGVSGVNTIDVSALRRPGADLKEGFTPSEMALMNIDLTENTNLEAFYQLKWRQSVPEGCGTFFSTSDSTSDGCSRAVYAGPTGLALANRFLNNPATAAAFAGANPNLVPPNLFFSVSDQGQVNGNLNTITVPGAPVPLTLGTIGRTFDDQPDDGGQFGFALRNYASSIGTEFGAYYLNYHSRLPVLSFKASPVATPGGLAALGLTPGNALPAGLGGAGSQYFVEYPEDISVFGGTFATNVGSWAVAGQVTHSLDVPLQINFNEILAGGLFGGAEDNLGLAASESTFSSRTAAAAPGSVVRGYDVYDITQVSVNTVKSFDRLLGSNSIAFVGEVGAVFVHDLAPTFGAGAQRYGRNAVFGNSSAAQGGQNGYVTDFSWGYRLRATGTYRDVFAGIDLIPQISFAHDVDGWSPEPGQVFNEGRQVVGLGLTFEFDANTRAGVNYTTFSNGADFDPLRDRDFISLTASYSF